ncbi:MAG TPA: multicopper oxidase family protein [Longimicrobiales bacterium]|nr:multicopper oxidase family protein [Longimicrobiales bacterium]
MRRPGRVPLAATARVGPLAAALLALAVGAVPTAAQQDTAHAGHHGMRHGPPPTEAASWRMPPMDMTMPMLPGLMEAVPRTNPFLPGAGVDPLTLPAAAFREVVDLADGDTLHLTAGLVRRTINGRTFVMYGFNGQYPGPLMRTARDATIVVRFTNETALPTTVHWHGVRLENRFDGVPGVTQDPVQPGDSFDYRVHFRDAGIYWYHPHHREDITQDLGLYGNMMVSSPDLAYYSPVNSEEVVMLDDILLDETGLFPWGAERATHALMGRFGNLMLLNGEPSWDLEVRRGDVVRFFFTNVANTRVFNLSFEGARVKLVGSDVGLYEREAFVESIVLAPAERYIVEVLFDRAGPVTLGNRIQAIDHYRGTFVERLDTLGTIQVADVPTAESHREGFERLRENAAVTAEIDAYRAAFERAVDHELEMDVEIGGGLPLPILQMLAVDTFYFHPVEWNDAMPEMNYLSTGADVRWILRDVATGKENEDVDWRFRLDDVVKLRLRNEPTSLHPMHHPIHLHGQRFLVLERDGERNTNFVWKDTAVIPLGSTVDLLVEMSNPGDWMLHCHISEHLETGMSLIFRVDP